MKHISMKEILRRKNHQDKMVAEQACNPEDKWVKTGDLQGEGRWYEYHHFIDTKGVEYQVWVDQDGDSKVVERFWL